MEQIGVTPQFNVEGTSGFVCLQWKDHLNQLLMYSQGCTITWYTFDNKGSMIINSLNSHLCCGTLCLQVLI